MSASQANANIRKGISILVGSVWAPMGYRDIVAW